MEKRHEIWHSECNLMERDHLEDLNVDGIMILKWIFKNCEGVWPGLINSGQVVVGCCECGNEPSVS